MGCSNVSEEEKAKEPANSKDKIVIGFSQLGAESDWRSANTASMKETFSSENGYELIFEDGQQKQSNQIMAIRKFIQQGVDYIVLAPVTETGWDTVLGEAKNAGIPVIIVDRMIDVEDEGLFTSWVGSDFELEGKKATKWLEKYTEVNNLDGSSIKIVNIQGTFGATPQIGRSQALTDAVERNDWNLLAQVPGDFTQAKAKEAMEQLLKEYDNINVVYCENDNEAFGAIEAIEQSGRNVGSDIAAGEIMVISFDGVNEEAADYIRSDKITCIAECNPHHGPRVEIIIQILESGNIPDKFLYVDGAVFSAYDKISQITVEDKIYDITECIELGR